METIKCGQALPSRRVAAAIRDESSAARTADGDVGFVRPLHSLHVRLSLLLRPHAVVLVSRFASRVGLVTLRQTFVCRAMVAAGAPARGSSMSNRSSSALNAEQDLAAFPALLSRASKAPACRWRPFLGVWD
jgi:hypothetical protein